MVDLLRKFSLWDNMCSPLHYVATGVLFKVYFHSSFVNYSQCLQVGKASKLGSFVLVLLMYVVFLSKWLMFVVMHHMNVLNERQTKLFWLTGFAMGSSLEELE
jgi:hypothetical protein